MFTAILLIMLMEILCGKKIHKPGYFYRDSVKMDRLDEILKDSALQNGFIKMDVEEHESYVVKGGLNTIKSSDGILTEFWPHLGDKDKLAKRSFILNSYKEMGFQMGMSLKTISDNFELHPNGGDVFAIKLHHKSPKIEKLNLKKN